ncbi:radical SAM/SPASM domain-containing protein [Desulfobacula phenolica]|uniref:Radical SAM superfamily enzyme, MoaA/NifB/PqqE/SkfB family n=1 Tax=Desulfobacula phenolica TaxID=90732 RepID=A0A1H2DS73_9BACT|nr:radical SAM protein [Desulfobacula phenolica]SDT85621.1 Radical SAM superfamily enzyme, MoaA/NifB/PqqE/SkfB family [Desulfobacula phenolica]
MEDRFKIDSHKLIYHVERVAGWLDNKLIYPIYMEISPSGACNHRCFFCSMDFMGYRKIFLNTPVLKERITELAGLGLKSIMFAGEGEPFLHKDLPEIIVHTKNEGIDVALTTNGVLMRPSITDMILDKVEWIKVSLNAGTAETYSKIHGTQAGDFYKVLSNMEYAVKKRKFFGSKCTLGLQILLVPENYHEVELLAQKACEIGADYLVVKPYTHHHKNAHSCEICYHDFDDLGSRLEKYNTEHFNIIFRTTAMKKWDRKKRDYSKCRCLPFWSYMDSRGDIWGCSAHLLEDRFNYGSLMKQTFKEIWEGEKRSASLKWVDTSLDIQTCKLNCRMDEVNRYLNELKDPPDHVNFI